MELQYEDQKGLFTFYIEQAQQEAAVQAQALNCLATPRHGKQSNNISNRINIMQSVPISLPEGKTKQKKNLLQKKSQQNIGNLLEGREVKKKNIKGEVLKSKLILKNIFQENVKRNYRCSQQFSNSKNLKEHLKDLSSQSKILLNLTSLIEENNQTKVILRNTSQQQRKVKIQPRHKIKQIQFLNNIFLQSCKVNQLKYNNKNNYINNLVKKSKNFSKNKTYIRSISKRQLLPIINQIYDLQKQKNIQKKNQLRSKSKKILSQKWKNPTKMTQQIYLQPITTNRNNKYQNYSLNIEYISHVFPKSVQPSNSRHKQTDTSLISPNPLLQKYFRQNSQLLELKRSIIF